MRSSRPFILTTILVGTLSVAAVPPSLSQPNQLTAQATGPDTAASSPDARGQAGDALGASPDGGPRQDGNPASSDPGNRPLAETSPRALLPQNFSPWAMFRHADAVVKVVMAGLAFASLVTWVVWIAKTTQLIGAHHRLVRSIRFVSAAAGLAEVIAGQPEGIRSRPVLALLRAAHNEATRSLDLPVDGTKERAIVALQRVEARAARRMTRGTGLIATIGSTAPFVGLFGTVWGIMDAFIGIGQSHTTNLAVVAPGIAEALLATAIGLVAAIPAVVIYNGFARGLAGYRALLADAAAEILRHLSRDLDHRRVFPAE